MNPPKPAPPTYLQPGGRGLANLASVQQKSLQMTFWKRPPL